MPMDRSRCPADWDAIARRVKDEAGWWCEGCGKQCRRPGEPFDTHRRTPTVAHLDHDPTNCRRDNLAALCATTRGITRKRGKPGNPGDRTERVS